MRSRGVRLVEGRGGDSGGGWWLVVVVITYLVMVSATLHNSDLKAKKYEILTFRN